MIENKKSKIVMMTMFKNEAHTIGRMLESCYRYIDYWVIQNNGSTDGTDEIVRNFFSDKNIPGILYDVEEGWVGFGWNRDHLIQEVQKINHGCDWILKMDCDEVLEVDDDFDWSLLDDHSIQAFHIPVLSGTAIYQRAWMYNSKLPWRFNHDPCHETVYCDIEGIKENFQRFDLPKSFRHRGFNDGLSWTVPTKFISHALILEEKMIREENMLTDLYHFWYIGKSYFDAHTASNLPLNGNLNKELARRCIFYFNEYIEYVHEYKKNKRAKHIDEMAYMGIICVGECYEFLNDTNMAIETYKKADSFAPGRNDHFIKLVQIYKRLEQWNNMLTYTSIMMQPERTNPYPTYTSFIDTAMYHDGGPMVHEFHKLALDKINEIKQKDVSMNSPNFIINKSFDNNLFVVDNFYADPDAVREFALSVEYSPDIRYFKGLRSLVPYRPPGMKEALEFIIGRKVYNFEEHGYNGCFQICTAEDPQVYHYDLQNWAAMVYLTPNAPLESGTRLHRSKLNGTTHSSQPDSDKAFSGGFYDSTKFDIIDSVGNVYNRLIIMDAKSIHSAGPYFGTDKQSGRLTHLFFFD